MPECVLPRTPLKLSQNSVALQASEFFQDSYLVKQLCSMLGGRLFQQDRRRVGAPPQEHRMRQVLSLPVASVHPCTDLRGSVADQLYTCMYGPWGGAMLRCLCDTSAQSFVMAPL